MRLVKQSRGRCLRVCAAKSLGVFLATIVCLQLFLSSNLLPRSSGDVLVAGLGGRRSVLGRELDVVDDVEEQDERLRSALELRRAHNTSLSALLTPLKRTGNTVDNIYTNSTEQIVNPHPFEYVINNAQVCAGKDVYVIAYVHTSPSNYKERMVIRETWGNSTIYRNARSARRLYSASSSPDSVIVLRVVFVMGQWPHRPDIEDSVRMEATEYRDIVQENFVDSYRNLTYKAIAGLRWVVEYCPHARYVLKADDDVFINSFNLLKHLQRLDRMEKFQAARAVETKPAASGGAVSRATRGLLLCKIWHSVRAMRSGKWNVTTEEWPQQRYPPYCSGSAYTMSTDTALTLYNASYYFPFFWIDDVYITGVLPTALGSDVIRLTDFSSTYDIRFLDNEIEKPLTGPQYYQYVFVHPASKDGELSTFLTVWKKVVKLEHGDLRPLIPFRLPKVTNSTTFFNNNKPP